MKAESHAAAWSVIWFGLLALSAGSALAQADFAQITRSIPLRATATTPRAVTDTAPVRPRQPDIIAPDRARSDARRAARRDVPRDARSDTRSGSGGAVGSGSTGSTGATSRSSGGSGSTSGAGGTTASGSSTGSAGTGAPAIRAPAPAAAPRPAPATVARDAVAGIVYPLWYGTNRQPVFENNVTVGYSVAYDRNINFGKVLVDIPDDFLKAPGWLALFRSAESRLRVRTPVPLDVEAFYESMNEQLGQYDSKEGLIYLHGFQTTFVEAAQRAAAIGYHLKMPLTIFYSWPSQGRLATYVTDLTLVERSEDKIAKFLIDAVRRSGATRVHLVAHSMGNQGLLRALLTPMMAEAMQHNIRFGQIILAAPDVDKDAFNEKGELYTRIADRVTLYASARDVALNASKRLRPTLDRAGLMPPPVRVNGVDVVDVGDVNLTLLGHSYVSEEIRVLGDMFALIKDNKAPDERLGISPFSRDPSRNTHWILQ